MLVATNLTQRLPKCGFKNWKTILYTSVLNKSNFKSFSNFRWLKLISCVFKVSPGSLFALPEVSVHVHVEHSSISANFLVLAFIRLVRKVPEIIVSCQRARSINCGVLNLFRHEHSIWPMKAIGTHYNTDSTLSLILWVKLLTEKIFN